MFVWVGFAFFFSVPPAAAFLDGSFHLPLEELRFTGLLDECAFCLHVSVLLTHDKEEFREFLGPLGQVLRIELRDNPPPKSAAEFGRPRRFVPPICCVSEFRRFVWPILWVSVILPIRSADLLGLLGL